MQNFVATFKRFADFSGRSDRAEFWPFFAVNILILTGLSMVDHMLFRRVYGISTVYFLLLLVPMVSLTLRRLRDAGHSGYYLLLLILGLYGWPILIFLLAGSSVASAQPTEVEDSITVKITKTLAALFCYSAVLFCLYKIAGAAAQGGHPVWLGISIIAAPILYLVSRLYTKWHSPWPAASGAVLILCVAAILLIAITFPHYSNLIRSSKEAATKSKLTLMREALKNKTEGTADINALIPNPPKLELPDTKHPPSTAVRVSTFTDIQDTGQWLYDGQNILIDCTHTDSRGIPWNSL